MTNSWVFSTKCFIVITFLKPHNTLWEKVLFLIPFDIWSKSALMILNNSIIKSLKAGLLVLKSGLHHYSCVLYIVFTLTKQINSFVGRRQTLPFFLSGHVKWIRRKMGRNKRNSWSSAAATAAEDPKVFQGGYRPGNVALSKGNVVGVSMPIILPYT